MAEIRRSLSWTRGTSSSKSSSLLGGSSPGGTGSTSSSTTADFRPRKSRFAALSHSLTRSGSGTLKDQSCGSKQSGLSSVFLRKRSVSSFGAEELQLRECDTCETTAVMVVQEQEEIDSPIVGELPLGASFVVLQVGSDRRARVSARSVTGWITTATMANEPLVAKRQRDCSMAIEGFEVGGVHEARAPLTVRAGEALDSQVLVEIKPGITLRILALGEINRRRAKIQTEFVEGWVSLATRQGELLVGKVGKGAEATSRSSLSATLFGDNGARTKSLLEAARGGDLETVRRLVEGRGASSRGTAFGILPTGLRPKMGMSSSRSLASCSDVRGKTPLIYAAAFGHREVVQYLLLHPATDVNALDDVQKSALHHASTRIRRTATPLTESTQAAIVQLLISARANVEACDHNGCTPLMFAAANGELALTKALLDGRALVNAKDSEGHAPIDYSRNFGHYEVTELLKLAGGVGVEDWEDDVAADDLAAGGGADADRGRAPDPPLHSTSIASSATTAATTADLAATPAEGASEGGPAVATKKKVAKKRTLRASKVESRASTFAARLDGEEPDDMMAEEEAWPVGAPGTDPAVSELRRASAKKRVVKSKVKAKVKGREAGDKEVEAAEDGEVAEDMARFGQAVQRLCDATEARSLPGLREALEQLASRESEVPAGDLERARAVMAEEELREQARCRLKVATLGDAAELRAALQAARVAGLGEAELSLADQLLRSAEARETAEAKLRKAIKDRDVARLRGGIQELGALCGDSALLCQAEEVLEAEEPKLKARQQLSEALRPGKVSISALRAAIRAGKDVDLPPEDLVEAKQALAKEEHREWCIAEVRRVLSNVASVDTKSIDALQDAKQQLSAAIEAAKQADVAEVHLQEAELRRRKLHNAVEDLKGSIRVFCRVRPLSLAELEVDDFSVTESLDCMTLRVKDAEGPVSEHTFQYDAVFTPGTQEEVFEDCKDLVQSAVDGYNVTLFAYGQTGAGKTYTMAGTAAQPGVYTRTIGELFRVLASSQARFDFFVSASMLELYNNGLVDLLSKESATLSSSSKRLNIRQDKLGMVMVEGLIEEPCKDAAELFALLDRGNQMRTVAATAMNSESSRSHLILTIKILSENRETGEQIRGKMLMCDLAGSERLKKSAAAADAQKEAIEINRSLTALGDVIEALTKGSKQIPYRNHKLTQLMQDSLGGSAKTLMFVNCSPASSNMDETLMSLKYASRAKRIYNTHLRRASATSCEAPE